MKSLIFVLSFFIFTFANAELLEVTKSETVKIAGVSVTESGSTMVNGQPVELKIIGAGLRKKYIIFGVGTNVYVAQILASQPDLYTKSIDGAIALDSLKQQSVVAVRLDFLYNVSADQLFTAFSDALKTNKVDVEAQDISSFLTNIHNGSSTAVGKSISLVMVKNSDGSEKVSYEDVTGTVTEVAGAAGLTNKIMSMWLGAISTSDKGLQELKSQLLQ